MLLPLKKSKGFPVFGQSCEACVGRVMMHGCETRILNLGKCTWIEEKWVSLGICYVNLYEI